MLNKYVLTSIWSVQAQHPNTGENIQQLSGPDVPNKAQTKLMSFESNPAKSKITWLKIEQLLLVTELRLTWKGLHTLA